MRADVLGVRTTFGVYRIPHFVFFVGQVLKLRILRKVQLDLAEELPGFLEDTSHVRNDPSWRVSPVPSRLQCRHVDIGDLSPCDTQRLTQALKSTAQGIQVIYAGLKIPFLRFISKVWCMIGTYPEVISVLDTEHVKLFMM